MTDERTKRAGPTSWAGRTFELTVGPVAHGGHCVSRKDGRVVFVRHALPDERVIAEVTEDNGGTFCRADAVQVLEACPDRVEPPCPLAAPGGCGGCDWQHATPSAQRDLKAQVVAEALHRLAGIAWPVAVEPLPGGALHWRSRLRLVADEDGHAGFRAHRSHRVMPLTECPIAAPDLLADVPDRRWRPGSEVTIARDGAGQRHVHQRIPTRGGARTRRLAGGTATEYAAGRTWRFDAGAFWQAHPAAAELLAEIVRAWACPERGAHAWDLYAGVGLFASVLANQVGERGSVLAVESDRRSAADGAKNLADLPQVRWRTRRVGTALRAIRERPEVVVLDPPRKGAGRAVVESLVDRRPSRVVYVACDPVAMARDVATFTQHGYRLSALRAIDAFPMTQHVECVALLSAE